jgi:hypothetical protein
LALRSACCGDWNCNIFQSLQTVSGERNRNNPAKLNMTIRSIKQNLFWAFSYNALRLKELRRNLNGKTIEAF